MGVSQTKLRPLVDAEDGPRSIPWGNEKRLPGWELRRWQESQVGGIDRKVKELLNSAGVNTKVRKTKTTVSL